MKAWSSENHITPSLWLLLSWTISLQWVVNWRFAPNRSLNQWVVNWRFAPNRSLNQWVVNWRFAPNRSLNQWVVNWRFAPNRSLNQWVVNCCNRILKWIIQCNMWTCSMRRIISKERIIYELNIAIGCQSMSNNGKQYIFIKCSVKR